MLLFADVKAFLTGVVNDPRVPILPQYNVALVKKSPQRIVWATLGGGPGLNTEQLFDSITLTLRVTGAQNDADSAEQLAMQIDTALLQLGVGNGKMGNALILGATRSGGRPGPISYDEADRTEYQCSYVVTASSGL